MESSAAIKISCADLQLHPQSGRLTIGVERL